MEIESIRHNSLGRFFTTGKAKGLVGDVNRLSKMLMYIGDPAQLRPASPDRRPGRHLGHDSDPQLAPDLQN